MRLHPIGRHPATGDYFFFCRRCGNSETGPGPICNFHQCTAPVPSLLKWASAAKHDRSWESLKIICGYLPNICGAGKPKDQQCQYLIAVSGDGKSGMCNTCNCLGKTKVVGDPVRAKSLGLPLVTNCPRWHGKPIPAIQTA